MITFICLFLPAIISVCIYERLSKSNLSAKNWVIYYALHIMLVNLLCFMVKHLILGTGSLPLYTTECDMTPNTAWKYIVMSGAFSVLLPIIEYFCQKKIKITVEKNYEEK